MSKKKVIIPAALFGTCLMFSAGVTDVLAEENENSQSVDVPLTQMETNTDGSELETNDSPDQISNDVNESELNDVNESESTNEESVQFDSQIQESLEINESNEFDSFKESVQTGWVQEGDRWAYLDENGERLTSQWFEYGGDWYYFDWDGLTYIGHNYIEDGYYYFDASGRMLTNQWIYDEYSTTYYAGSNGKLYTGVHTIDGNKYLFSEWTYLETYFTGVINNVYYETDENGIITVEQKIEGTGWVQMGDRWTYVESDGSLKQNQWYQENGVWYYFDSNGLTCIRYNYIDNNYYYFNENGHMLTNQWIYDEYSNTYYAGNDGKLYTGAHTIDGNKYLFNESAYLQTYFRGVINNVYYETDENGIITVEQKIKGTGWVQMGDRWAYVESDGSLKQEEWYQENGVWYYFGYDYFTAIGYYNLWDYDTESIYYYYFDENGHMLTNQWIYDEYTTYYAGSNGKLYTGIHTIGGVRYLFNESAYLQTYFTGFIDDVYYETNENGIITVEQKIEGTGWVQMGDRWAYVESDGSLKQHQWYQENGVWYYFGWEGFAYTGQNYVDDSFYYFDENGHMLTNQWIYDEYSNTYYAGSNGKLYTGAHVIEGKKYLFSDSAYLQIMYSGFMNNVYYETNENGVITVEQKIEGSGWVKIGDRWAYVESDGSLKQNQWYQENGIWYYFDWNGFTYTGHNYVDDSYYYFDENGHMLTNQWIDEEYSTYYAGSNGKLYTGANTIDGKLYLFTESGYLINYQYSGILDDVYYETALTGKIIYQQNLEGLGWIKVKDRWIYKVSEDVYKLNEWYQENGVWYYFGYDYFTTVGLLYISGSDYNGYNYYFDSNGHMMTNYWALDGYNNWAYFGDDGRGVTGLNTINGIQYYFSSGFVVPNTEVVIDGICYITDENGAVVQKKVLEKETWQFINGSWYLFDSNGNPYKGFKTINGITYYFYEDGLMATGVVSVENGTYGFDLNGHLLKNAWWKDPRGLSDIWYYFGSDGKTYHGWLFDKYYINHGIMTTGTQRIEGKIYIFDLDGNCIVRDFEKNEDGWYLYNGRYYYVENHTLPIGWKKINNVWYYFSNGIMVNNTVVNDAGNYYYLTHNGSMLTNSWQKYQNSYVYAESDGKLAYNCWRQINAVWYYFEGVSMVDSDTIIDGTIHRFDGNGHWLGSTNSLDGWLSLPGGWRYYQDGTYLTGWQNINGNHYYFVPSTGIALENTVYAIDNELFYFMDNCAMAGSPGWVKTVSGEYVYLDSNHRVVTGWQKINGTWYYLDPYMCTGIQHIEGEDHQFSSNGAWLGAIHPNDGWYNLEGRWYFVENGVFKRYTFIELNGNTYFLDMDGQMTTGLVDFTYMLGYGLSTRATSGGYFPWNYYFDESGKLVKNQWIFVNNKWIYADNKGRVRKNVTLEIDGKRYSFDENGYMI